MYVNGQGVLQDYGQARMWLRKGAEQGNSLAQNSLGFLHAK
jgi:TPR repeat protein